MIIVVVVDIRSQMGHHQHVIRVDTAQPTTTVIMVGSAHRRDQDEKIP